jgi:hypothetical protein
MYLINKVSTGVKAIDSGLNKYFGYLAKVNVLPPGDYALAGGCIRALLDKTRVRDLDVYILGDKTHHETIIENIENDYFSIIKFCNPFAHFKLLNITPEQAAKMPREDNDFLDEAVKKLSYITVNSQRPSPDFSDGFTAPIQLISYAYDSKFYEREPSKVNKDERFADAWASTLSEIVNSFDMTISKGGAHFTITDSSLIVNSINIPHDCLIDICMKTLRFSMADNVVPQQLCGLARFHKFIKLGYDVSSEFYVEWRARFDYNPHVLGLSYD